MRALRILIPALLLLPALSHAQGARTLSTRLTPPERVGGFRLASIKQMEGRAGGQMRYRSAEGLELDAFLYPLPDAPDCERDCDAAAAAAEVDAFRAMIPGLVQGGEFDSLVVMTDEQVRVEQGGAAATGRHLRMRGAARGRPVRSHLLVYGVGSYLARVRATFPPGVKQDSLARAFAEGFVRAILQPAGATQQCALGPADTEDIRSSVDSRLSAAELRAKVPAALAALGFTLDPAAGERDAWRTLPVEGWPAGIDYGAWAREASPGFVVGVTLEERAGAAPRLTVSARAVCVPASATEDPRALELGLELRTAGEVLGKIEPPRRRSGIPQ
ncbi:MAG TPA: hypothetical protein VFQ76_08280 [Longimicrobiaceae bacterium]|nr:hypothetical protein [Longimicrobiaceae bacterium]